jgi:hypothetical protein
MPGASFSTRLDAPPQDGLRREDASLVTYAVRAGPATIRGMNPRPFVDPRPPSRHRDCSCCFRYSGKERMSCASRERTWASRCQPTRTRSARPRASLRAFLLRFIDSARCAWRLSRLTTRPMWSRSQGRNGLERARACAGNWRSLADRSATCARIGSCRRHRRCRLRSPSATHRDRHSLACGVRRALVHRVSPWPISGAELGYGRALCRAGEPARAAILKWEQGGR